MEEKAKIKKAGHLNWGRSYVITTVQIDLLSAMCHLMMLTIEENFFLKCHGKKKRNKNSNISAICSTKRNFARKKRIVVQCSAPRYLQPWTMIQSIRPVHSDCSVENYRLFRWYTLVKSLSNYCLLNSTWNTPKFCLVHLRIVTLRVHYCQIVCKGPLLKVA